jgi:hypothetical protein
MSMVTVHQECDEAALSKNPRSLTSRYLVMLAPHRLFCHLLRQEFEMATVLENKGSIQKKLTGGATLRGRVELIKGVAGLKRIG